MSTPENTSTPSAEPAEQPLSSPGAESTPRRDRKVLGISLGWIVAALLIAGFSYLAFSVLAPWQLGKNQATQERNALIKQAYEVDPAPFAEVFQPDGSVPKEKVWRRVTAQGTFLPDAQVILRKRPVGGKAAYQVLTPFKLESGLTVLVNRGFVPSSGDELPSIAEPPHGKVTISGYAQQGEAPNQTPPAHERGIIQVQAISPEQISKATGVNLAPDTIQLAENQAGTLSAIPLPQLENGPYLSYGIQWVVLGALAPVGLIWGIWAQMRERRRAQAEASELDGAGLADAPRSPDPQGTAPAAERKREDRPAASKEPGADTRPRSEAPASAADRRRNRYGKNAKTDRFYRRLEQRREDRF